MKRARIAHDGRATWAEVIDDGAALRLPGGARIAAAGA
ncbi:MAG: hypothetical protein JWO72_2800, partial [Caulobacteraceae bacterium]|nr:hypothetical protein [Caulobacteraceae bacterium]